MARIVIDGRYRTCGSKKPVHSLNCSRMSASTGAAILSPYFPDVKSTKRPAGQTGIVLFSPSGAQERFYVLARGHPLLGSPARHFDRGCGAGESEAFRSVAAFQ